MASAFSSGDVTRHVHHLCLDEWKSIVDIEIYLRSELESVKQTHPLQSYLSSQWPSEDSFKKLLHKSFESFAYASSAMRYISSHDRHPEVSLNNLLGLSPDRAYEAHAELDSLYRYILESLDEKTRYTIRKILCIFMYLSIRNVKTISSILKEAAYVVELAVIKLSSVIRLDKRANAIFYYHTSFSDYLEDEERCGALYLRRADVASTVATSLSRCWMRPSSADDYRLLDTIGKRLADNISAADMHIHVLRAFLATPLPTTIVVPPGHPHDEITRMFSFFFIKISTAVSYQFVPYTLIMTNITGAHKAVSGGGKTSVSQSR